MSLVSMTLDQIDDLPEFADFPEGLHHVNLTIKYAEKNPMAKQGDKDFTENATVTLTAIETLKLSDRAVANGATPVKTGDLTTVSFRDLANEWALGDFKTNILNGLGAIFNTASIGEIIENASSPVECVVSIGKRKGKKPNEQGEVVYFTTIKGVYGVDEAKAALAADTPAADTPAA